VDDQLSPALVDFLNFIPWDGPKLVHVINILLKVELEATWSQKIHSLSSPAPPLPGTAIE
jgi:hypothetical protein